jgi:hypothetical protein
MLKPSNRTLLLESLRPPTGFELDRCLGTTYSLDLQALLTAPLAFTIFEREDPNGRPNNDPLALLESMRRYADRMHIFCQSGRIQIPKSQDRLYSYLEDSVIQVVPPGGGVFHPKLWLLRYLDAMGSPMYRLLCLSRNLTFDRSWDTALCLDGRPTESGDQNGNLPLVSFLQDLPNMSLFPLPETAQESIALFSRELSGISFDPPPGFDAIAFHPMGTPGSPGFSLPETERRLLIVSPFLSQKTVANFSEKYPNSLLLTRLDSAQEMPADTLRGYHKVYILSDEAELIGDDQEEDQEQGPDLLTGLHAKLYVLDSGSQSRIWTGSANATEAAFRANVEFLVELQGPRDQVGIEAVLGGEDEKDALRWMLQEYVPWDDHVESVDELQQQVEEEVERAADLIGRTAFRAEVSDMDSETCRLCLAPAEKVAGPQEDIRIECWPITVPEGRKQTDTDGSLSFGFTVSREAMTAFFAFSVNGSKNGFEASSRCVIKAELKGAPADRFERLLQSLLHNQTQVLRLLLLLLTDKDSLEALSGWTTQDRSSTSGTLDTQSVPLLETLLRSLHRDPVKLDRVERLVEDLCRTDKGKDLLPEGFLAIWRTVQRAREGLPQ